MNSETAGNIEPVTAARNTVTSVVALSASDGQDLFRPRTHCQLTADEQQVGAMSFGYQTINRHGSIKPD